MRATARPEIEHAVQGDDWLRWTAGSDAISPIADRGIKRTRAKS
jgi:hypothetical protein